MSDNELDAELLGMVGDDSDEEGEMSSRDHSPARSPPREADRSAEQADEPPSSRKGVAQKVRARGRRKRQPASDDDDDNFGIASPSPSRSLGSEPMAQSDSDADAPASPDAEDGPLYPIDGKYLSARDRDEILAMPEIRREEILAERAQEVIKRQQDMQLKKALATARAAGNKQKRKAAAAELEDSERRSIRPKAEKGRTALDDYRRARERKGTERGRVDAVRSRRDERSPSTASERDADGDSEVEWPEPASDRRRDEPPPELRDFERCRVGRSNFAKICFYPNFENAVRGCFCRVSIGPSRETGQMQYRMAQIKSFTEGKPYQMEGARGKRFTMDLYAVMAQGSAETPKPFSACSDGKLTPSELERFEQTLRKEGVRMPTRKFLNAKLDDIHKLLNTEWTDEQISAKLNKQKAMERKYDPVNAANAKREAINKRKLQAEADGDAEEIMKCDAELAALENSVSASNGLRPKPQPVKHIQQERLAQINLKNRGKNSEEVRRALIEEKRRLQLARQQARDQALNEAKAAEAARSVDAASQKKLAAAKDDTDDLFGEPSEAGTPGGNETPKRNPVSSKPANGTTKKEWTGGLRTLHKPTDDEVIGALDFGIDIEI